MEKQAKLASSRVRFLWRQCDGIPLEFRKMLAVALVYLALTRYDALCSHRGAGFWAQKLERANEALAKLVLSKRQRQIRGSCALEELG